MRFQLAIVEHFLRIALQLLTLTTAIVAMTLSASQSMALALAMDSTPLALSMTPSLTPVPAPASAPNTPAANGNAYGNGKGNGNDNATPIVAATDEVVPKGVGLVGLFGGEVVSLASASSALSASSAPAVAVGASATASEALQRNFILAASGNSNDSNEIDGEDYVMTKHIASHDIASAIDFNKTQDLSSLSLLLVSYTNTTTTTTTSTAESAAGAAAAAAAAAAALEAATIAAKLNVNEQHRSAHGSPIRGGTSRAGVKTSDESFIASFQQIGSQRIAAEPPALASQPTPPQPQQPPPAASSAPAPLSPATTNTSASRTSNGNNNNSNRSNIRTSAKKVEAKYILPKPQKTDAPMLNYIFDTFSTNKHHHHDQRYGPHFEDVQRVGQPTNITVQAGSSIHLNCRISLLQDKTVSWVRRNVQGEENGLDLLTVGLHTYTGDQRFKMEFQYPNNWRLKITNVKKDDEAMYECQISTHPPRVIQINLHVNAPKVMIVDEFGDPLQEKYYEIDSTLQLSCMVRNVAMSSSVVYWRHGEAVLNYDVTRGGVSVKTELMEDGANSTLSIAKIKKADSGNYTCSISDFQNFTIVVHILNGESFAELHHGGAAGFARMRLYPISTAHLILFILHICLSAYIPR